MEFFWVLLNFIKFFDIIIKFATKHYLFNLIKPSLIPSGIFENIFSTALLLPGGLEVEYGLRQFYYK